MPVHHEQGHNAAHYPMQRTASKRAYARFSAAADRSRYATHLQTLRRDARTSQTEWSSTVHCLTAVDESLSNA